MVFQSGWTLIFICRYCWTLVPMTDTKMNTKYRTLKTIDRKIVKRSILEFHLFRKLTCHSQYGERYDLPFLLAIKCSSSSSFVAVLNLNILTQARAYVWFPTTPTVLEQTLTCIGRRREPRFLSASRCPTNLKLSVTMTTAERT